MIDIVIFLSRHHKVSSYNIHYSILVFSDNFKLLSDIEVNFLSQFLDSKTEGNRYHDVKHMFTVHMPLVK